jgi:hypothetical protein
MRHLLAATLCAAIALPFALPQTAAADLFGPISLASESATQQATYARDPAISGNGRYVAFDGSFGGETGVFRRDLATGVVEPVAAGETDTPAGSATLPSISETGQYVSFTTTAQLTPGDTNKGPDVYVRNMEIEAHEPCKPPPPSPALQEPCAYELASAVNGSEEALTYKTSSPSSYGSVASGRSALSVDGRYVVFVTTAISNLADPGEVTTPALQVAVRDLQTGETHLVSVAEAGGPAAGSEGATLYGAVYAPGGHIPPFEPTAAYSLPSSTGASISADGSTVAWMGQDISAQAPTLPGEFLPPKYTEPLWRRISPAEPTRRITGGSDPSAPGCAASGQTSLPQEAPPSDPCQGPFLTLRETTSPGIWQERPGDPVPQLSANGSIVAFISQAPPAGDGNGFGELYGEAYVADMSGGLSRVQALRPLTELASGDASDLATTAPIIDLGISPDGSQVAFTTRRTQFPLGSLAYVSQPAAAAGMAELFDVDLDDDTLTRVTHGFEGGPAEHPHAAVGAGQEDPYGPTDGALSPSFSDNGDTLAFSSTASNLVYGDGNTPPTAGGGTFDGSDAFAVSRTLFDPVPTPQEISPAPPSPALAPNWQLYITAASRPDGSVLLEVEAPGSGTLHAYAESSVRVRASRARRRGRASTTVAARVLASTTNIPAASADGLVALTLKLTPRYQALAREHGGLSSTASVTFAAPDHPTLRQSIAVTFRRTVKPAPHPRSPGSAAARRRGAHGDARR